MAVFGAYFSYNYFEHFSILLAFVIAILATIPGLFFYFITESHAIKYQTLLESYKQTKLLEEIKASLQTDNDQITDN
jgi:hypothetical protein